MTIRRYIDQDISESTHVTTPEQCVIIIMWAWHKVMRYQSLRSRMVMK